MARWQLYQLEIQFIDSIRLPHEAPATPAKTPTMTTISTEIIHHDDDDDDDECQCEKCEITCDADRQIECSQTYMHSSNAIIWVVCFQNERFTIAYVFYVCPGPKHTDVKLKRTKTNPISYLKRLAIESDTEPIAYKEIESRSMTTAMVMMMMMPSFIRLLNTLVYHFLLSLLCYHRIPQHWAFQVLIWIVLQYDQRVNI